MAIPYQATKFKSTNIFAMAIVGPTAKFNSHQYFRLCSIIVSHLNMPLTITAALATIQCNKLL